MIHMRMEALSCFSVCCASQYTFKEKALLLIVAVLWTLSSIERGAAQLSLDYYKETCPDAEKIIRAVMVQKQKEAFVTAAGTLRIFFHDCFVQGCDASLLIASTQNNKAEKDANDNLSLPGDGFDAVMRAKAAVEKVCPGVVSCADIVSITTRDLVGLVGGPFWEVLKGRKDGRVSLASNVVGNLPQATMNVDQLTELFQRKGFTRDEMVVLSGAHTIGFIHCDQFMHRIYNFSQNSPIDPTMSRTYALQLQQACPKLNLDPTVVVFSDVTTPKRFDNAFFKNAQQGKGVLASDQVLWTDWRTRTTVNRMALTDSNFFSAWVSAMHKLSLLGVKAGNEGEVRRNCASIN